jgi:hypothetical protein
MKVSQILDMIFSCSPLFVSIGLVERCSLENFGSPWHAAAMDFQTFENKQMKLLTMQGGC